MASRRLLPSCMPMISGGPSISKKPDCWTNGRRGVALRMEIWGEPLVRKQNILLTGQIYDHHATRAMPRPRMVPKCLRQGRFLGVDFFARCACGGYHFFPDVCRRWHAFTSLSFSRYRTHSRPQPDQEPANLPILRDETPKAICLDSIRGDPYRGSRQMRFRDGHLLTLANQQ